MGGVSEVGGPRRFALSESAMFKQYAYDPIGIAVMGFGILAVVALTMVF